MAVIIPMAKIPNNCEECDLKGLCPDYWTKIREEYTRPSWCQLDDLDATTFCGVPMKEAVEIMQMYRRGELVHFKNYAIKDGPQPDNGIGCSRCDGRRYCYDRDTPHAVHCNNYGKITD